MLRVKTRVQKSSVHGLGLFAHEFIPKGTVTWQYDPLFDVGFSEKELETVSELGKKFLLFYCYLDKELNKFILCADNQRFINHTSNSAEENIRSTPRQDIADRDIQPGEEMLCDYHKFDDEYFRRHGIEHRDLH
jgi:SET domain-containing protein